MIVLTAGVVVLYGVLTSSTDAFTRSLSFRGGSIPLPPSGHPSSLNATMGHSHMIWALGLDIPVISSMDDAARRAAEVQEEDDDVDNDLDDSLFVVSTDELSSALEDALDFCRADKAELVATGWTCVADAELFNLFKRRVPRGSGYSSGCDSSSGSGSSTEYLMVGKIPDVTPRNFLHAQLDTSLRPLWDKVQHVLHRLEILCFRYIRSMEVLSCVPVPVSSAST